MSIKPPFTELEIEKAPSGFYEGYSLPIALISKAIMVALVVWALIWPGNASSFLSSVNGTLPFTIVMVFMMISLIKALYRDSIRSKQD